MDCVFCKISTHAVPSVVLQESDRVIAFFDCAPIRRGHVQIIPKEHFETFELLPPVLATEIFTLAQNIAKRMKEVYSVERVAFLYSGGDVPHAHAHVVPMHEKTDITSSRYIVNNGNIQFDSSHLVMNADDLEAVKKELGTV